MCGRFWRWTRDKAAAYPSVHRTTAAGMFSTTAELRGARKPHLKDEDRQKLRVCAHDEKVTIATQAQPRAEAAFVAAVSAREEATVRLEASANYATWAAVAHDVKRALIAHDDVKREVAIPRRSSGGRARRPKGLQALQQLMRATKYSNARKRRLRSTISGDRRSLCCGNHD